MICENCGVELRENDRFCPSCGTAKATSSGSSAKGPSTQRYVRTPSDKKHNAALRSEPQHSRSRSDDRNDYRLMGAYNRSFTTPAIFTLVLYIVLWLPGFIANIVYLREANEIQKLTGEAPEGKGCLVSMIVVLTLSWALVCVFWFVAVGGIIGSLSGS